jgi:hypothetical protein
VTLTVQDADGNTVTSTPFNVHIPNTLLWLTLLAIIIASVCATAGLAANHRRKLRKLERGG